MSWIADIATKCKGSLMRIALGGILHETNTFCKGTTPASDFTQLSGAEITNYHDGVRSYCGGVLEAAQRLDIEVVPTFLANATPSATIARDAYEQLRDTLLEGIREALPVDAVVLTLHGSGVAEDYDDIEGDIAQKTRQIVGPDVPIVITLDLHGNMTQEMVDAADALFPVHHYPHIDMYERGQEAVEIIPRLLDGSSKPTTHLTILPMMIPTTTSNLPPVSDLNEICFAHEQHPSVIDCAMCHGFAPADTPHTGVTVMVTTENDPDLAREIAENVASEIWERVEAFRPELRDAETAVNDALAAEGRPVIVHEGSDNPGGGGPGDGTHLLRAMIEADLDDACFGFIWDPEVAAQAHQAGPGATIDITLGGKTEEIHGDPLNLTAYVKCVTDGQFTQQSPMGAGAHINLGKMARLVIGGIDVIVGSRRAQTLDPELFLLHGIDVERYKIVAFKSSAHFRAAFEPIAAEIIHATTPGLNSVDILSFTYNRVRQPIWPLNSDVQWQPASN